jgi:polyhydroxybutyrate depolymerase
MPPFGRFLALVAALTVALLLGGTSARGRDSGAAPAAGAKPQPAATSPACAGKRGGRFIVTIRDEHGLARTALVNVPTSAAAAGRPLPLVIALHGAGGNGRFMERYTGLTRVADRAGFAVMYPDAVGKLWQYSVVGEDGADDVSVIRALLDRLEQVACVDAHRVYATGVSNGGGMAARLACNLSDRLAAVAPVAGGYAKLPACQPGRPLSVLEIHGTADRSVPYDGVPPGGAGSVARLLAQWGALDKCPGPVRRSRATLRVLRVDLTGCQGGTSVSHLKVLGGEHAWPGTPLDLPGNDSRLSATQAIWQFFSRHRRAAPFAASTPGASG